MITLSSIAFFILFGLFCLIAAFSAFCQNEDNSDQ